MVDTTDKGEVRKANATMTLLNERIPDPNKNIEVKKIDKRFGPRVKKTVEVPLVSSSAPTSDLAPTKTTMYEEVLFREAMLVVMRNLDVKSPQGLLPATRVADEYVAIIQKKFGS